MIPVLLNHDPTAIIGWFGAHGNRVTVRLKEEYAMTREQLFNVFGNCGFIVLSQDEHGLITHFEIREFSWSPNQPAKEKG